MTLTLNDLDWVQTRTGNVLHRMSSYGEAGDEDVDWWFPVLLDCGRTVAYATVPGMFTRMGAKRCDRCCAANDLPRGIGSPKNDAECRKILGLPTSTRN